MVVLKKWQWLLLISPIAGLVTFLLISAGWQIHQWGINWIWGLFILILAGWRWLLVKWTRPGIGEIETAVAEAEAELATVQAETANLLASNDLITKTVETALQSTLETARNDLPIWEDWTAFWQRCQELIVAVAHAYHPEVKYPLLNIYIPQAYGLMRGTVDDMDRWMEQLSPALNKVTVGQGFEAYEVYRKLEPSARKLLRVWNFAQWFLNPAAALAKQASQGYNNRATEQLLGNLGQMLREVALRNLCKQAVALYGSDSLPESTFNLSTPSLPKAQSQTLQEILATAEPTEVVEQKPVNILLVGRTGSGKSSLINTLFQAEKAEVDVLPSTDRLQSYHWQVPNGESLTLWDTPGYEQANRTELRELVLDYAINADLLLLVTPALDPALQMDADFLEEVATVVTELPTITVVTQVDRLRPIREWQPPYNWRDGNSAKETSIREATKYRAELLGQFCNLILPTVTRDAKTNRNPWNIEELSLALVEAIAPAKQLRLARFLRDREARSLAAAKIIDRYTLQMATTQGLTALLKSPVLQFISTMSTGSPTLAYALSQKIPVEQLPVVIGKLQMGYELHSLLEPDKSFDLLSLWNLLLENSQTPDRNAWAFGHSLVEYWTQNLTKEQLSERFAYYLQRT